LVGRPGTHLGDFRASFSGPQSFYLPIQLFALTPPIRINDLTPEPPSRYQPFCALGDIWKRRAT
jgi:hypothetical protein